MDGVRVGTVKFFNKKKGYGFVIDDETKKEYFFHWSSIDSKFEYKILFKGYKVRFILGDKDGKDICTWICSAKDLVGKKDESAVK